jgi:alanyl-tRNA synthetase
VIVNQTPFYGESGGQVGDTGASRPRASPSSRDRHAEEAPARCSCTRRQRDSKGTLKVGDAVELAVDHRPPLAHPRQPFGDPPAARGAAQVLGTHVAQKGSLVSPDRLRFDFCTPSR